MKAVLWISGAAAYLSVGLLWWLAERRWSRDQLSPTMWMVWWPLLGPLWLLCEILPRGFDKVNARLESLARLSDSEAPE